MQINLWNLTTKKHLNCVGTLDSCFNILDSVRDNWAFNIKLTIDTVAGNFRLKAHALNQALRYAKEEIVAMYYAGDFFPKNKLVEWFL